MSDIHPYLEMVMRRLSTLLYNGSQSSTPKDQILNSIKRLLEEYNEAGGKAKIEDFRDKFENWRL